MNFLKKFWIYPTLASFAAISFYVATILPSENLIKFAATTPGFASLFAIIVQVFRDNTQYQKNLSIQQRSNDFILGVTSHISEKAFNKYSEFCDEYVDQAFKIIQKLIAQGVSTDARSYAIELANKRRKYINWIPQETKLKLIGFEDILFTIGSLIAKADYTESIEEKEELLDKADQLWCIITGYGIDEAFDVEKRKYAYDHVEEILKKKLGVEEVTKLRSIMIEKAMQSIEHASN